MSHSHVNHMTHSSCLLLDSFSCPPSMFISINIFTQFNSFHTKKQWFYSTLEMPTRPCQNENARNSFENWMSSLFYNRMPQFRLNVEYFQSWGVHVPTFLVAETHRKSISRSNVVFFWMKVVNALNSTLARGTHISEMRVILLKGKKTWLMICYEFAVIFTAFDIQYYRIRGPELMDNYIWVKWRNFFHKYAMPN